MVGDTPSVALPKKLTRLSNDRLRSVARVWQTRATSLPRSGARMKYLYARLYICLSCLFAFDEGQDLVEYGLVVALIACGAITGLKFLSSGINTAFSQISFWNK
jgi:Flp pilus assembly pilin Flp